jgi:hypothetical protein
MSVSGDFLTFRGKSEAANFATPHSCHHTSRPSTSPQTTSLRCFLPPTRSRPSVASHLPSPASRQLTYPHLPWPSCQVIASSRRNATNLHNSEIRPDPTDDERESMKHVVQEPNSDTVVPETQLDHNGHYNNFNRGFDAQSNYDDDIPLSPNSLAVLERTAVTKKREAPEPTPFTFKLLSKTDRSASLVTPAFSFRQARKAPSKTPPKEEVAASQSTAHASLKSPPSQQLDQQVPDGNTPSHPHQVMQ